MDTYFRGVDVEYDSQSKLRLIQQCLMPGATVSRVARAHGLDCSMLRFWVDGFRANGEAFLQPGRTTYSVAFKLKVVRGMRRHGLSLRQAAARYDVRNTCPIRRWCELYDQGGPSALTRRSPIMSRPRSTSRPKAIQLPDDQHPVKDLLKELAYLRAENAYLKKTRCLDPGRGSRAEQRARAVQGLRPEHALSALLEAADLSRSTFYYQLRAQQRPDPSASLKSRIRKLFAATGAKLGYRSITDKLQLQGMKVNHKRVQRLMQAMGLRSIVRPKKYDSYKGEVGQIAPNLLNREFSAEAGSGLQTSLSSSSATRSCICHR